MSLRRKFNSIASDSVLRSWIFGFILGKWQKKLLTTARPPYLNNFDVNADNSEADIYIKSLKYELPEKPFYQKFAGTPLNIDLKQSINIEELTDTESQMAFHRFSWMLEPLTIIEPAWVVVLWKFWLSEFGKKKDSLAWHPYTVSERLINLLRFFLKNGFPNPGKETRNALCEHGIHIFDNLEYYGEEDTGNHLLNNGRALYLAGILLKLDSWIKVGLEIIIRERGRIFNENNELKEGSVHYHLLISSWYLECWLAARDNSRPEEKQLLEIVRGNLYGGSLFDLPGGLPLIGDVSPDCSPNYLNCLITGKVGGWLAKLRSDQRQEVLELIATSKLDPETRRRQKPGEWWRKDLGQWSVIGPKAKDGWQPYPGHGHQDFGGFELHFGRTKIFVDIGRRSYDIDGDIDKAATSHNVLTVDEKPAYPENRAYYSREFKNTIVGSAPNWNISDRKVSFSTGAFERINGVGSWTRKWSFFEEGVQILDAVDGSGYHQIDRYLYTILKPEFVDGHIICGPIKIVGAKNPTFSQAKYWSSYAEGEDAYVIKISGKEKLPFTGKLYFHYKSSGKD